MIERGVSENEVAITIRQPDRTRPGDNGATNYYKDINGRIVRVTVGSDIRDINKRYVWTVATQ